MHAHASLRPTDVQVSSRSGAGLAPASVIDFGLDQVENWVKSMHFYKIELNLTCSEDLCKLGKEYLNTLTYKYCSLSR